MPLCGIIALLSRISFLVIQTGVYVVLFFVFLYCTGCKQPTPEQSSFEKDTDVELLYERSLQQLYQDTDSAKLLANRAIVVALKKQNLYSLSRAYNIAGSVMRATGQLDSSLYYHHKALQIRQAIDDKAGVAGSYNNMAVVLEQKQLLDSALSLHFASLEISKELGNKQSIADSQNNIALIYLQKKNLGEAQDLFWQALQAYDELDDMEGVAICKENLGVIYLVVKDLEQSLQHSTEAVQLFRELGNRLNEFHTQINISKVLILLGKPDEALHILLSYLSDPKYEAFYAPSLEAYMVASESSLKMGNIVNARMYLKSAYVLSQKEGSTRQYPKLWELFSQCALAENNLEEAKEMAEKALSFSDDTFSPEWPKSAPHRVLADIYYRKNNIAAAFRHLKIADSLTAIDHREGKHLLSSALVRYETQRSKQEVEKLTMLNQLASEQAKWRQILLYIISFALTVFLALGALLATRNRKVAKQNMQLAQQKEQIEKINAELMQRHEESSIHMKELVAQAEELQNLNKWKDKLFGIISHDLKSPLNSLKGLLHLLQESSISQQQFAQMSVRLADSVNYLSYTLENMLSWALSQLDGATARKSSFSLSELTNKVIFLYEEMAQKKDIRLYFSERTERPLTVWADKNQVSIIIRNLTNNALKYTRPGGEVRVSVWSQNDWVWVSIADNGVGMSQEQIEQLLKDELTPSVMQSMPGTALEKGTGLGMRLTKEYIKINEGTWEIKSAIREGTTIKVGLPPAEGRLKILDTDNKRAF